MGSHQFGRRPSPTRTFRNACALACLATLLAASAGRAALVIQAPDVQAAPGSTGSFDVVILDTGGAFQVAGDTIELTLTGPAGVTFTGVSVLTGIPYIYAAPSAVAFPPFSFDTFPNTHFQASDSEFAPPFFRALGTGDAFGLAHVTYSVAAGAIPSSSGTIQIGGNTSLSDANTAPVPFTIINGTFRVVPEPSSLALLAIGAGLGIFLRRGCTARRRREGSLLDNPSAD